LDNGDLLIVNEGDVTSSILFSISNPKLYQINDLHKSTIECCIKECNLCDKLDNLKVDDLSPTEKILNISTNQLKLIC